MTGPRLAVDGYLIPTEPFSDAEDDEARLDQDLGAAIATLEAARTMPRPGYHGSGGSWLDRCLQPIADCYGVSARELLDGWVRDYDPSLRYWEVGRGRHRPHRRE